jgi:hypothetical protein
LNHVYFQDLRAHPEAFGLSAQTLWGRGTCTWVGGYLMIARGSLLEGRVYLWFYLSLFTFTEKKIIFPSKKSKNKKSSNGRKWILW